jgi:hypothetical protein
MTNFELHLFRNNDVIPIKKIPLKLILLYKKRLKMVGKKYYLSHFRSSAHCMFSL